ncbi:DNA cytosine methyltransferase [Agrococcus sp. ARC_14]|uniref:DNA cytosine methyltransferase n=1 Tax=Agrococcus sp. ARC_14 TaxID=2919927 RepID=UPI001F056179|nr:DNA cytosine methyltransferase [Agrococcus sp. ARC_14]MCH1882871.1 DNA cytosine methyltransferase [Agrococcus sp. ARC_14]
MGSLFSGDGGLDLAVEHVFNARTVWFSELNEPVARVFSRHWPDAPNLGDITTIDCSQVKPVHIPIGGCSAKTCPPSASAPASHQAHVRIVGTHGRSPTTSDVDSRTVARRHPMVLIRVQASQHPQHPQVT